MKPYHKLFQLCKNIIIELHSATIALCLSTNISFSPLLNIVAWLKVEVVVPFLVDSL